MKLVEAAVEQYFGGGTALASIGANFGGLELWFYDNCNDTRCDDEMLS